MSILTDIWELKFLGGIYQQIVIFLTLTILIRNPFDFFLIYIILTKIHTEEDIL